MSAFIEEGFSYKGKTYRALSAESILFLKQANSPLFSGGDNQLEITLDYLLVTGKSRKEIRAAQSDWENARLDLAAEIPAGDMIELSALVAKQLGFIAESLVEVRDSEEQKKTAIAPIGSPPTLSE